MPLSTSRTAAALPASARAIAARASITLSAASASNGSAMTITLPFSNPLGTVGTVGFGRTQHDGADPHPTPMIGAALSAQPQAV